MTNMSDPCSPHLPILRQHLIIGKPFLTLNFLSASKWNSYSCSAVDCSQAASSNLSLQLENQYWKFMQFIETLCCILQNSSLRWNDGMSMKEEMLLSLLPGIIRGLRPKISHSAQPVVASSGFGFGGMKRAFLQDKGKLTSIHNSDLKCNLTYAGTWGWRPMKILL